MKPTNAGTIVLAVVVGEPGAPRANGTTSASLTAPTNAAAVTLTSWAGISPAATPAASAAANRSR